MQILYSSANWRTVPASSKSQCCGAHNAAATRTCGGVQSLQLNHEVSEWRQELRGGARGPSWPSRDDVKGLTQTIPHNRSISFASSQWKLSFCRTVSLFRAGNTNAFTTCSFQQYCTDIPSLVQTHIHDSERGCAQALPKQDQLWHYPAAQECRDNKASGRLEGILTTCTICRNHFRMFQQD